MPHVFLSYQHDDADFVEVLKARLERADFEVWADSDQLRPGEDWREGIDQAIKASSALIVVMTPAAKASEYVTYEWSFAWGARVPVIPLLLKATLVHPRLETLQYLDFTNRQARPWERLIERVRQLSAQTPAPTTIPTAPVASPITQQLLAASSSPSIQRLMPGMPVLPAYLLKTMIDIASNDADVREAGIEKLSQINSDQARELFLKIMQQDLDSSDKEIRSAAMKRLIQINSPKARTILIDYSRVAVDSAEENERLAALRWLAQVNWPEARNLLIATLHHPLPGMPFEAALHLAQFKEPEALAVLIHELESDDVFSRSLEAISAMTHFGTAAVPALLKVLDQSDDSLLHRSAAMALGKLKSEQAVPMLIRFLADTTAFLAREDNRVIEWSIAEIAAQALQQIGTPQALAAVEEWRKQQDNAQS